jgi:hypothetical protein
MTQPILPTVERHLAVAPLRASITGAPQMHFPVTAYEGRFGYARLVVNDFASQAMTIEDVADD